MQILGIGSPIEVSGHPGVVSSITSRRVEGKLMPIVGIRIAGREVFVDGPTIE